MSIETTAGLAVSVYSGVALMVCVRLLYAASRKYDWADWQFNRDQILNRVMLRVFLWPFFLVVPRQLTSPDFNFKPNSIFLEDVAERARKRSAFMDNPPPCSSTISVSGMHGWTSTKGEFLFQASAAHEFALKKWREDRNLPGLRGAIWWLGQRDDGLGEKTPVPEILLNFDRIVHDMIDAGVGQVRCPECNRIYAVTEIVSETSSTGSQACCSTVWKFLKCPEKHDLMSYEYMRLYFKRPEVAPASEEKAAKPSLIAKFTAGLE